MDNVNIQIPKGFGVKCKNVLKEKSFYVCYTDKGVKVVKKSGGFPSDVEFQHALKENLYKSGFEALDRYLETPDSKPYCFLDGELYTMSDYYPYKEADFIDRGEVLKIVEKAGKLHNTGKKIIVAAVNETENEPSAAEIYKKSVRGLNADKKKVLSQARMSDFDVLFLKNSEYILNRLKKWYDFVELSGGLNVPKNTVCHNNLKEENILVNKNNVYFINFSACKIDNGIYDLADIIRRYLKLSKTKEVSAKEILNAYMEENPLTKAEINALYAVLLFPDKFLKICSQFYAKKRNWVPGSFITRLSQQTDNLEFYENYIKGLIVV